MVRPKKHLGQHFLTDPSIAERITGLISGSDYETILEVGPGKGILTDTLVEQYENKLILIDLDRESVEFLNERYRNHHLQILHGDFLRYSLDELKSPICIIGNFPYNISSQILFHVLDYRRQVGRVTGMLQKEVAQRIASPPGNKQYGILSVLLQAWFTVRIRFHVKPGSFFPAPEVDSSVVDLVRNEKQNLGCREDLFKKVVKTGFSQRRKQLGNTLKSIFLNLPTGEFDLTLRPEQLSVNDFIQLTSLLEKYNPDKKASI